MWWMYAVLREAALAARFVYNFFAKSKLRPNQTLRRSEDGIIPTLGCLICVSITNLGPIEYAKLSFWWVAKHRELATRLRPCYTRPLPYVNAEWRQGHSTSVNYCETWCPQRPPRIPFRECDLHLQGGRLLRAGEAADIEGAVEEWAALLSVNNRLPNSIYHPRLPRPALRRVRRHDLRRPLSALACRVFRMVLLCEPDDDGMGVVTLALGAGAAAGMTLASVHFARRSLEDDEDGYEEEDDGEMGMRPHMPGPTRITIRARRVIQSFGLSLCFNSACTLQAHIQTVWHEILSVSRDLHLAPICPSYQHVLVLDRALQMYAIYIIGSGQEADEAIVVENKAKLEGPSMSTRSFSAHDPHCTYAYVACVLGASVTYQVDWATS
ncbi:hypothetical protein FIBSPDRAFT_882101 [Athelia psychrophila]|uniref:Uncharacterized protein n=1 Tax=Athelia psychrophila TaxID=1759441 RepID=A0A166VHY0_9AGAM|nr:hypothetical protein FIBSPDRAFT_882101 [Fibularhizoctonia sp. CBS 109695]